MDFSYSDDHQSVADLAKQVFRDMVSDGEADPALWQTLADAGLLGVALGSDSGGSDLGFIGAGLVLREQGAVLAPVPLLPAMVAALSQQEAGITASVARFVKGESWSVACVDGGLELAGDTVSGELACVPFALGAETVVATAGHQLLQVALAQPGVSLEAQQLTSHLPAARLRFKEAKAQILGTDAAVERLRQRLLVATAMLQLGVVDEALARTAAFTVERSQFGQPLARFQAVAQRAADAYIDVEALRATAESALWRLDAGQDATLEAATALWWAAEAGHRVAHTAQHLHGGIGADIDYPIHRYFLWAKQVEFSLGGAAHTAARIGRDLALHPTIGGRK
ncbi:acyl-CoA dehydrogenase [Parahaliea maris]|uniref:Acyl-CoA dehydrogenase n=1 Tax=Parahaliea maris TaxID=2716870 RepID=A0A5C9A6Y4_9GAMM|nr:acyl-CoA dehydrogenase family protein [Parahaliea maris]TXS95347.1 acyl-CoA dehydrogenase [Parahaliea maris]